MYCAAHLAHYTGVERLEASLGLQRIRTLGPAHGQGQQLARLVVEAAVVPNLREKHAERNES